MNKNNDFFTLKERGSTPKDADYSVKISGAMAEPYIRDNDTVSVAANADLENGDVGIFLYAGKMIVRQYCEDSFGNIYLFTLDREKSENDLTVRSGTAEKVICFGKVLLKARIPLPE